MCVYKPLAFVVVEQCLGCYQVKRTRLVGGSKVGKKFCYVVLIGWSCNRHVCSLHYCGLHMQTCACTVGVCSRGRGE